MKIDPILFTVLSDIFANLSAAWFAAALIPLSAEARKRKILLLSTNIAFGIIALFGAYILKKLT